MPIYEFRCRSCEQTFEELVRNGDEPRCPRCDGAKLEKLLSSFAVGGTAAPPCGSAEVCNTCGGAPGSCAL